MNYVRLGDSGLMVSPLCLGTMMFGDRTDEASSNEIIGKARDAGCNFIDTADVYSKGASERIVGAAIKPHRREWILATKCANVMTRKPHDGGLSRRWIMKACEDSLTRLSTDYIDILYLHGTTDALVNFACAGPRGDAVVAHFGLGEEEVVEEDESHRWTRHTGADAVYEFIEHDYAASTALIAGHCFPGSQDEGGAPGQLFSFACVEPNAFVWGDAVRSDWEEDRILADRRRLLEYYGAHRGAPAITWHGVELGCPLDGCPRVILSWLGAEPSPGSGIQGQEQDAGGHFPGRAECQTHERRWQHGQPEGRDRPSQRRPRPRPSGRSRTAAARGGGPHPGTRSRARGRGRKTRRTGRRSRDTSCPP